MSRYERYDQVAADYDRSRIALGTEIIAGLLAAGAKPLEELELLDAGCGTGNYSAALAGEVGRITAVDLSAEMLAVARAKLAAAAEAGRIDFREASIDALPFTEASFDAVMFNQVLHHLEAGDDPAYGGHRRALAEAHRVLRPGGRVVVNVCSHEQLQDGYWYYGLIPAARSAVMARCVTAERLEAILRALGFVELERSVPLDGVMQGPDYFRGEGPLDPDWRRGDSIWALATPEELAAAQAHVTELAEGGALEAYVAAQDAKRPAVGQFTFFTAVRPS